ncbi:DnaJ-like protein 1 [Durusdinium trenchii]|uniref:DnaJ-like protein 1 n=1 Tax=Durusdinium trenchii TaxID=1381693 RepID=A0ABP0K5S1_9DINO
MAQRRQKSPTYEDIKATNQVVRMAQQAKDEKMAYSKLGDLSDLILLVYHDAAWANIPEYEENLDDADQKYSQLGHITLIAHKNILEGETGEGLVACWKSHACTRVCRSTFAAETMAALEGHVEAAIADWQMALQFLGKELGLDFLESTEWPLRSAQILFALAEAKAIVQSWPEIPMRERWNAVDPFSILVDPFWSNCVQVNPAQKLKERKPNVVLYGYHPVLVEPVSALSEVLQLHWFGVSDRDCAFFKMCNKKSTEKPVPARLRFKIYESDVDLNEVEDAYRIFWEAEMRLGLRADLIICMELRDAFFLWKITEVAMIYYPAIIFMQDEAMNDYSADVLIQQFEELRSQDVLRFGGLQTGTVAMVAQSPYLAASLEYHTGQKLPSVRPLARYVEVKYQPNSSSILVLCARSVRERMEKGSEKADLVRRYSIAHFAHAPLVALCCLC